MNAYHVWTMNKNGNTYRVAKCNTLRATRKHVAPFRNGYVYIMVWHGNVGRHLWGCLNGQPHTNDMRRMIRRIVKHN